MAVDDGASRSPTRPEIAGRTLRSRLILGTGRLPRLETLAEAIRATRAELVTVALRRIDAGRARLARRRARPTAASSCSPTPPAATRRATPCSPRTWRARRSGPTGSSSRSSATSARCCPTRPSCSSPPSSWSTTGFMVLPYTNDDPILARRLEDVGLRRGHAARVAHRLGHRHPQPVQPDAHRGARACRSSSTPAWARPATRRWPWSSAATACCAPRRSRGRRIRSRWPMRSVRRSRPGGWRVAPGASRAAARRPPRPARGWPSCGAGSAARRRA